MKQIKILLPAYLTLLSLTAFSQNEPFDMRQLACGLSQPWEITYGPDDFLWVTEAHSYQIDRINTDDGSVQMLLDLSGMKNFANYSEPWPQGGLQGIALHPQLLEGKPYVYVAYVHFFDQCLPGNQGCFFKTKIARFTYDPDTQTLSNEEVLIDTLPGSTDHNGGRLVIGPGEEQGNYLFYSIGDMGAGHLGNGDRPNNAQNPEIYEGKILRFNLEPDGDAGMFDRWIPNDNPFNDAGGQSAIWSLGHRNPQGLVFGDNGVLYEAEHGPYSDDEINVILPGVNYGHPLISGFADGNYNGSAVGAGSGVPLIASEQDNRAEIEMTYFYSEPLVSMFPASQGEVMTIYQNDVNDTPPFDNYYLQWPTAAPSGLNFYGSDAIPGWENSLLVATLKSARVFRFKLGDNGQFITGDTIPYFEGLGRFRDIAISPDGTKIYVSADSVGTIKGAPGEAVQPPNKGCILEFTYSPTAVKEELSAKIRVFPNPADQSVMLDFGELQNGLARITAFNSVGMTVFEKQMNKAVPSMSLDVSGWPDGQYFLAIQPEGTGQQIMKKVTVMRTR